MVERAWRSLRRAALIGALTVLVSGCAAYDWLFANTPAPSQCPEVSVLPDARDVIRFSPGVGRDISDVVIQGEISDVAATCSPDINKKTQEGTVSQDLTLVIDVQRGVADRDRKGTFEYFVAVTDSSGNVLSREKFSVTVEFAGNRTRLRVTDEPVLLQVPLRAGKTGSDFKIFVGFQLTPEELDYNRRHGQRSP